MHLLLLFLWSFQRSAWLLLRNWGTCLCMPGSQSKGLVLGRPRIAWSLQGNFGWQRKAISLPVLRVSYRWGTSFRRLLLWSFCWLPFFGTSRNLPREVTIWLALCKTSPFFLTNFPCCWDRSWTLLDACGRMLETRSNLLPHFLCSLHWSRRVPLHWAWDSS